jgi:hypothetical protein
MPASALISLVILLSLALSAYEIFKIFGRDFGRALGSRFTLLVGFLNLIAAVLVWGVVHNLIGVQPSLLSALVTGLTFPTLLRSRFTLYRSIGSAQADEVNELSLKMDEVYHTLQRALYREVNLQLTTARLELSHQIRESFTARQLADYLADFMAHERLPDEQRRHQRQLDEIMAIADPKVRHRQLANLLLDLKTAAKIKAAVRRKDLNG